MMPFQAGEANNPSGKVSIMIHRDQILTGRRESQKAKGAKQIRTTGGNG